jgi:prefoldin alpha subunit
MEKDMELQLIAQQLKEVQEQLQQVDSQIEELGGVKQELEKLRAVSAGTEIWVPVTSGVFVQAKIGDTDRLRVNTGANVVVGKSIDQTKSLMESQMKNMLAVRDQLIRLFLQLNKRARELNV